MKTVKYRCVMCGHSELPTWKDTLKYNIFVLFFLFGIVSMIGIVVFKIATEMTAMNLGMNYLMYDYTEEVLDEYDAELRAIALNMTSNVQSTDNSYPYAQQLYMNLRNLKYRPTSTEKFMYNPLYVLENGGDCRNTAVLFTAMMRSLGLESYVDCDTMKYKHCVSIVPLKRTSEIFYDRYVLVDISNQFFRIFNETESTWDAYARITE